MKKMIVAAKYSKSFKDVITSVLRNPSEKGDDFFTLLDMIQQTLVDAKKQLNASDIDVDDISGSIEGDPSWASTFVFNAQIYHSLMKDGKPVMNALTAKERKAVEAYVMKNIQLPPSAKVTDDEDENFGMYCNFYYSNRLTAPCIEVVIFRKQF